ncbi:hypothetical protein BTZ53_10850 [Vibrio parahaemolyticus]|uniref:hypothetical protein n=1 Tax=Vibrio parahaemolyticus TaxID=670 RepID=UPI000A36E57D|nr:hypothetical protein [Vibrio parahaemolyticus]OUJ46308.1 hypothetical protein BTZ53_10850 [Vibrio parahaemolyticus]HCG6030303.1 hypothetical protein [Vibrio parahaemolyticus]HCG6035102.1 hypothetical protein [Vibrio parahaemolyticus]
MGEYFVELRNLAALKIDKIENTKNYLITVPIGVKNSLARIMGVSNSTVGNGIMPVEYGELGVTVLREMDCNPSVSIKSEIIVNLSDTYKVGVSFEVVSDVSEFSKTKKFRAIIDGSELVYTYKHNVENSLANDVYDALKAKLSV